MSKMTPPSHLLNTSVILPQAQQYKLLTFAELLWLAP